MDRIGANLMDATAFKLLASLALGAVGLAGWWVLRAAPRAPGERLAATPTRVDSVVPLTAEEADALLAPHRGRLRAIRDRSRFSAVSFERECLGLVRRVLAHPHYANAGRSGEVHTLLTQTYHSLGYRQAMLLPPGALAEDIEPRSYRWTFGVFVAAMLHDLRWSGAWVVAEPAALRDLLRPWMDAHSLQWLLEDEELSQHLQDFLSQPQGHNVLHHLVRSGRDATHTLERPAAVTVQAAAAAVTLPPPAAAEPASVDAPVAAITSAAAALLPANAAPQEPATTAADDRPEPTRASPAPHAPPATSGPALAQGFMQWLTQGLADQTILSNAPDARVHFAADGMVLVAPGIFQQYASEHPNGPLQATPPDITAFGKEVLRAVCAEGWHLRGPQNANMHRFQFKRSSDGKTPPVLRALVIQAPQRFITTPPPPHPGLSRLM